MLQVFRRKASGQPVAINPAHVEHVHEPEAGVIIVMHNGTKFQVEGDLDEVVARLNDE